MKKVFLLVATIILIESCNKEVDADFTLNGTVKGLKKGTVYLQKFQDSMYVTLDSVVINGESSFSLYSDLAEPEVLFVRLDKNAKEDEMVAIFADKGIMTLTGALKNFSFNAKVLGSSQQETLEQYMNMMTKFNEKNLQLIEDSFNTKEKTDTTIFGKDYQKQSASLLRRKYLYTINFAVMNADSEVSPYLALYEIPNANPKYLDTIYYSLSQRVKESKYGLELKEYLSKLTDTLN